MHLVFLNIDLAITGCGNISYEVSFLVSHQFLYLQRKKLKEVKYFKKMAIVGLFNPTNVKGIAKELNKLANNYNYYQR